MAGGSCRKGEIEYIANKKQEGDWYRIIKQRGKGRRKLMEGIWGGTGNLKHHLRGHKKSYSGRYLKIYLLYMKEI